MKINPNLMRVLKYATAGAVLLFVVIMLFKRARVEDLAAESRLYLKLRRAYEKAGYDARPHDAPMRFVTRMRQANAPGHEAAGRAIELYLRSRFGGEEIGEEGKRAMRDAAQEALRSITRRRADPASLETSAIPRAKAS